MTTHRAVRLAFLLALALLAALPPAPGALESTAAGRLRASLAPARLEEIRREMSELRSGNRWPSAQQDRYLDVCLKQRETEPSLNRRTCECELEVMMDRYMTFGDLVNDLVRNGGAPSAHVSGLIGMCLASFGS